jgi:hypothetical protein
MSRGPARAGPLDFEKLEVVSLTPAQLEEYAGRYHSPELQNTFTSASSMGC